MLQPAEGASARIAAAELCAVAAHAARLDDAFCCPPTSGGGVKGALADKRWADLQARKLADVTALRALDALRGRMGDVCVDDAADTTRAHDALRHREPGEHTNLRSREPGECDQPSFDSDDDDDGFLRAYRESRLAELSARAALPGRAVPPSVGCFGELRELGDAGELPAAVDSVLPPAHAVLLVHERALPACVALHAAMRRVAREQPHLCVLAMRACLAGASFDPIALPALVVYSQGRVVATLLRAHEAPLPAVAPSSREGDRHGQWRGSGLECRSRLQARGPPAGRLMSVASAATLALAGPAAPAPVDVGVLTAWLRRSGALGACAS